MIIPRHILQQCIPCLTGHHLVRQVSSCYNGVSWDRRGRKFRAQVCIQGMRHHVGSFDSEEEAAAAHDDCLRQMCRDRARLKKSLNFPTLMEASFQESKQEARARGLAKNGGNAAKEELSFRRLQAWFLASTDASSYVLERITASSRTDALLKPVGADSGIRVQLKSATARGPAQKLYMFNNTRGYEGMLLILVALDNDLVWAVPGKQVAQQTLGITLGTDRDRDWRMSDICASMAQLFHSSVFPLASLEEARLECGRSHKVEEQAHLQMSAVFSCIGFHLTKSLDQTTVDSMLCGEGQDWRVQEKASNARKRRGDYVVSLKKRGGRAFGCVAYAESDFDLLLSAVLDDGKLIGLFLIPMQALAELGLVGQHVKAATLRLCPPWALPKTDAARIRYAWQLDFFLDLRSLNGEMQLSPDTHNRLQHLMRKLAAEREAESPRWNVCVGLPRRSSMN